METRDTFFTNDEGLVIGFDIFLASTQFFDPPIPMDQAQAVYDVAIANVLAAHPNYRQDVEDIITQGEADGYDVDTELSKYRSQLVELNGASPIE